MNGHRYGLGHGLIFEGTWVYHPIWKKGPELPKDYRGLGCMSYQNIAMRPQLNIEAYYTDYPNLDEPALRDIIDEHDGSILVCIHWHWTDDVSKHEPKSLSPKNPDILFAYESGGGGHQSSYWDRH
jgi:hypothetical protein